MKVPFLDLKEQYAGIREEIRQGLEGVLESGAYCNGPAVQAFESQYAQYCGCRHAVAVTNGTTALWAALTVLEIGCGDEVITVPNTFVATVEAIYLSGARPVFVDVDPGTALMDPEKLERAITSRTKAIIPVHLYGRMAPMDRVMAIARRHGLKVIEDAAQAHGAIYQGRCAGTWGDMGCFSFYPGKNLGAYGEGGAIISNDDELAARLGMFRDHGQLRKYQHETIGWNCRMASFQGAVLSVKLHHLDDWTAARRRLARRYRSGLTRIPGVRLTSDYEECEHVHHLLVIRVTDREKFREDLERQGIASAIHYPFPIHLMTPYRELGYGAGDFPEAEAWCRECVSLPMFPELNESAVDQVVGTVRKTRVDARVPRRKTQVMVMGDGKTQAGHAPPRQFLGEANR